MPKPPMINAIHARRFGCHWRKTLMSDISIGPNLSRLDGPAAEWNDGSKAWYVGGKIIGISDVDFSIKWFDDWEEIKEKYYGSADT